MGATPYKVREVISQSIEMMLNSRNNAFYGIFMALHHSLGFPNMILEGGSFDPMTPPGSAPDANSFIAMLWCKTSNHLLRRSYI